MRLLLILLSLLIVSRAFAQESDSLRRYEAQPVTVEESRRSDVVIKGVEIRTESVSSIQATTGENRMSEIASKLSPSISNRKYGSLGGISLLSFRGLPPEYTVIFRDGIRLTNEQNSLTDLARISANSVERIELLPNTSSILLGGDAIGAAINLVSPTSIRDMIKLGSSSLAYKGLTPGELEHELELGVRLSDEWGVALSGTRQYSSGDYPFWNELSGNEVERENNDAQLHDILLRVQRTDETLPLTFTASHVRALRGAPGAVTIRGRGASAFVARQNDEDLLLGLRSRLKLGEWSLDPGLSYQSQYEEYQDLPKLLDEHYKNKLYAFQLRADRPITDELDIYAGASLQASSLESNEISTADMPTARRNKLSAYLASAYEPRTDLLLTGAVRMESISDRGSVEVLPQLSAKYEIIDGLDLTGSYGLSYHAPTLNQLHWKTLGNPDLRSEHAQSAELGVSYHEALLDVYDLRLGVTTFSTRSHDQILWLQTESSLSRPINVQDSRSRGAELAVSVSAELSTDLTLSLAGSYTFLDAKNITANSPYEGKRLPFSARNASLISALITTQKWGTLGFTSSYRGLKYSDLGNTEDGRLFQVTIYDASYTLPQVAISDPIGLSIQISGQNLSDQRHYEVYGYPLPGRTLRISTTLTYLPTQTND